MKINNKKIILILLCILTLFCIITILLTGRTYTLKFDLFKEEKLENISIKEDKKIVKLLSKKIDGETLILKYKSLKQGRVFVEINYDDLGMLEVLYVHPFGIITQDTYFGDCTNSIVIAISITILIGTIVFLLIKSLIKSMKNNMYSYKNVTYLGLIIFLGFAFISNILSIYNYRGVINTIESVINMSSLFSQVALPIIFIIFIFVTISNIKLIIKEGFSIRNLLGLLLGLFILILTIAPIILGEILQRATWIDVHNENGIALYIERFIENYSHIIVAYLECMLIGTIILGIKSALHTPKYDKDYIIILGCKIRNDGTVTPLLKARVDKAIKFRNKQKEVTNKDLVFIASGGQGKDEVISEGLAIKNYLLTQGIKEKEILLEDKSTTTYENIKYSKELIKKDSNLALSTTNYHVFRACEIAYNQGVKVEGIGANTKPYFWINAFVREFVATLSRTKKYHILALILITILLIVLLTFTYFNVQI